MPAQKSEDSGLRTIPQACEFLGCSRSQIYKLHKQGKLEMRKLGRHTRVTKKSLDQLVRQLPEREPSQPRA
jgi:excisionase family DNA binding protein